MNKELIWRLSQDAINAFHEKYPDEDPFIRVVCMRHYKHSNREAELRGSWRGTIIDNKTKETVLRELPKKKTIRVSKDNITMREKTVNKAEIHKAKLTRDEKTIIKAAEKNNMKLEIEFENVPHVRAEYVIDSTKREYDNRVFIRGVNCYEVLDIESIEPISVPVGTVIDVTDVGTIEASVNEFNAMRERSKDLSNVIRDVNVKKAKLDNVIKRAKMVKEGMINVKGALSELKDALKVGVESTKNLLGDHRLYEKTIVVKDQESKKILGKMSIEDLVDKHVQQQTKLNAIKAQILSKIGASVERHKESMMKDGFILTIPKIINALVDDNNRLCELLVRQAKDLQTRQTT